MGWDVEKSFVWGGGDFQWCIGGVKGESKTMEG